MPDELQLEAEIEEGWESAGELIPQGMRRALSLNVVGSKLFDRLMSMILSRIKWLYHTIIVDRALWNDIDVEDFLYVPESGSERPPQHGVLHNQYGVILRKSADKDEPVYFRAPAKWSYGTVRLKLTADGTTGGDAVIAVGVAEKITGPWRYYYAPNPWTFVYSQTVQEYDVDVGNLEVGRVYYYRIVRQRNDSGDTLDANVLLAGARVR
jgi:hypothetical protein